MLARHICQFPFQICPVPQCVWQYHVRFPTTYIQQVGRDSAGLSSGRWQWQAFTCRSHLQVGGVSFLHVLLPGTVDDVFSLVRGPEDVHFCGAMCGNAGGVWCLVQVPHHTIFSPVATLPLPFRLELNWWVDVRKNLCLPLHWSNIWCTLAWSRCFFFGPALEAAKFGTFWPPISMKQAYCASTSMQKNLRKLRFRARNRNFCPAGRCCFPRSGHSFHGQHLSVLQFATCVMGAVEWLPRLNDWSGYGQTLRCAYPMEVHQFSRNIYDTRVACEIGCIGFSCGSVVMLLCNILAPEFMQKSMEDQLRELFRGTSQSGCLPSRDLLQSLCLNGEPSFRMCHCSFIEITMAWLPFSNLKIVL